MVIAHYEHMGIDPKSKTIIFSDGLDYGKHTGTEATINLAKVILDIP